MDGLTVAGIACVALFGIIVVVCWVAARIDDRLEEKKIRDEWTEIERSAKVVPEPAWSHEPVTDEEATVAFIAYLAEKNDTWISEHITGELPVAA